MPLVTLSLTLAPLGTILSLTWVDTVGWKLLRTSNVMLFV